MSPPDPLASHRPAPLTLPVPLPCAARIVRRVGGVTADADMTTVLVSTMFIVMRTSVLDATNTDCRFGTDAADHNCAQCDSLRL